MNRFLLLLFLAGAVTSCGDSDAPDDDDSMAASEPVVPESEELDEQLYPVNMAPEFVDVLEAHGGIPVWNNAKGLSFLVRDFPTGDGDRTMSDFHRVNLGNRHQVIEGDDYKVVSRGDTTWVTPDASVTGVPPRMYQAASFYFMGMPFVFGDKGLTVTYAGETEFGDETVDEFVVTVPDDMGDGGNDYQLFADTASHQLKYGTWEVTYPAVADMGLRQMVEFNEWQDVDGLVMPSVITLYTAPGEITEGTPGATIGFERVSISQQPFAESVFATPEGAVIDDSASK